SRFLLCSTALRRRRRGLALGTKKTASPGDEHSPNHCCAAKTALPFASVSAMAPLIFSRLALGVKEIGNGGAARQNGFLQDVLQDLAQRRCLLLGELRALPCRMNLCAPQTFVGVDVADSAQDGLIEQQGLDPCAARADALGKFLRAHLQRISAKVCELFSEQRAGEIGNAAEAARIDVAQLASVVQSEPDV